MRMLRGTRIEILWRNILERIKTQELYIRGRLDIQLLRYAGGRVVNGISMAGVICVIMGVYKSTSVLGVDRETTREYRMLLSLRFK